MLAEDVENKSVDTTKSTSLDDKKPFLGIRWIIVILSFLFYFVMWFVRNSFPVAVVAMVNATATEDSLESANDVCPAANSSSGDGDSELSGGEFGWTVSEQGTILGAYFWGFLISKLFLSRLGEIIGPPIMVASGGLIAGIVVLMSPLAASKGGPYALAATRFIIGLCYGPVPSAYQTLYAAWALKNERASMLTTTFSGATLGGMTGLLVAGWLTDQYGWKSVFWLGGALSFVMPPIYLIVVRSRPENHPWLSDYERKLLKENMSIKTQRKVPWKKISTSPYVWICVYALFARGWLDTLVSTEGPSFFKNKIGLDVDSSSYVTGINYLSAAIFINVYGWTSDYIITKQYLSVLTTRKELGELPYS